MSDSIPVRPNPPIPEGSILARDLAIGDQVHFFRRSYDRYHRLVGYHEVVGIIRKIADDKVWLKTPTSRKLCWSHVATMQLGRTTRKLWPEEDRRKPKVSLSATGRVWIDPGWREALDHENAREEREARREREEREAAAHAPPSIGQ